MKKVHLLLIFYISSITFLVAGGDEGMWLPLYIKQLNEQKMQQLGCKLTAEDIYSINHSSIKDAVVRLGQGFCTGEIVSDKGLVFTNHHCGYESIAELSSVDNDFLTKGFWARTMAEEIPIPNLTVSRLVYMEDVTQIITESKNAGEYYENVIDSLINKAIEGTHYEAEVKSYFGQTEYYLLVYETFKDIRFVGAPPSSIGKFGGDTDNWMWPRHTGDFSILRIYTGPDGKPAEFSDENIPYKPLKFFPISLKGVQKNDFSMIMGYPGTTERYLSHYDLDFKMNFEQPALIDIFKVRLEAMKSEMDKDNFVRIELASDYASLANSWKYLEGQLLGLKNHNLIEKFKARDEKIDEWISSDQIRKEKYSGVFSDLESAYSRFKKIMPGLYYLGAGLNQLQIISFAGDFAQVKSKLEQGSKPEELASEIEDLWYKFLDFRKLKTIEIEKKILPKYLLSFYNSLNDPGSFAIFRTIEEKYKTGNIEDKINLYCNELFSSSIIFDSVKFAKFKAKPNAKALKNEMFFTLDQEIGNFFRDNYLMIYLTVSMNMGKYQDAFIAMLREYQKDKVLYPDANSTLRMTYGQILPYRPRDGVFYKHYTTHYGILEKENPDNDEFIVDPKLKELLLNKDFGPYGVGDTLYICFLSNNDITGGNSGSPVINANGELIGIAFDGNWEAMTGDLIVDPNLNRTISVDIRYVLFIIDKFAGADNLISELSIIK